MRQQRQQAAAGSARTAVQQEPVAAQHQHQRPTSILNHGNDVPAVAIRAQNMALMFLHETCHGRLRTCTY
jgi:hypothetical protein